MYRARQRNAQGVQARSTHVVKPMGIRRPVWNYAPQCPSCGEWSPLEYTTSPILDPAVRASYFFNQRVNQHPAYTRSHPARMFPALARDLVLAYSEVGDIVLDPFSGIGTTLVEAYKAGRFYLGMEKSSYYHRKSKRWLYEAELEAMR